VRLARALLLGALLLAGSPTAARAGTPTSIQDFGVFAAGQSPGTKILPGTTSLRFCATLIGASGEVSFDELTPSGWTWLVTGGTPPNERIACADVAGTVAEGAYHYRARYDGTASFDPSEQQIDVDVVKGTTGVDIGGPSTVQAHHPFELIVGVSAPGGYLPTTGALTLRNADTNEVLKTGQGVFLLDFDGLPAGTYSFVGDFAGDGAYEASQSSVYVLTVTADTVDATGVGVSSATVYPYRDGYLDSVSIRGTRQEAISVAIKIYNNVGHVVRSASIASGLGAYSFAWNGRTSSGVLVPVGKYRVVQTLTDANSNHRSVTSYVTVSAKRIYLHTIYIYRLASQYSKRTSSWIGWQFSLPSATIYKSLILGVDGRSGAPPAQFGAWDFRVCSLSATWGPGCVTHSANIGPTLAWYSLGVSSIYNRSGHYVRAFAFAGSYATGTIVKVRLKVVYGILK
jgi:hypothetical protein